MEFRRFRNTIPSKIHRGSKPPADWVAGLHIAMNGNSLKSGKVAKQGATQSLWRLHTFVHFMPRSTDLEGRVRGRVKCSGNKLSWGEGKTQETQTQGDATKRSWGSSGKQTVQVLLTECLKTECEPSPLPKFWFLLKNIYIDRMIRVRGNRHKFCALTCTLPKKKAKSNHKAKKIKPWNKITI